MSPKGAESVLNDYDKTRDELEETLKKLVRGGVEFFPAMLAMGDLYARIVTANLPHEIALELVATVKLKIEKLNLEKFDDLPVF